MIIRSLITFFAIIISYHLLTSYAWNSDLAIPENVFSENLIKTEKFIYQDKQYSTIIIGSSLASRFSSKELPENFYNLSLTALNVEDGINILEKSSKFPERLLIEINHLDRVQSQKFQQHVFNQPLYSARKHLTVLRESNKPSLILASIAHHLQHNSFTKKLQQSHRQASPLKLQQLPKITEQKPLAEWLLKRELAAHAKPINKQHLQNKLKRIYQWANNNNIKLVFFEMATHKNLCNSAHLKSIRNSVQQFSQQHKLDFIKPKNCSGFNSRDSHHVDSASASVYLFELLSELP